MSTSPVLRESDLIFPSASTSVKSTLTDLHRTHLSITNRLRSIKVDSEFVQQVAEAYQLPLIANERCGSWYVLPEKKEASAYFKSTDGHAGQWSFSLRRLNVQILSVVGASGGCIIVDSTRRGKSMPDALSKTIPIWCAVMNRLLFPHSRLFHMLCSPKNVVSESEHAQIETRLDGFVTEAQKLNLDLSDFRAKLRNKPLTVTWQRPGDLLPDWPFRSVETNLVVLCTASNDLSAETTTLSGYVQGAADDSESWAFGLDAATFWMYSEQLLLETEDELPDLIKALIDARPVAMGFRNPVAIDGTVQIFVSNNAAANALFAEFKVVISCSAQLDLSLMEGKKDGYIHLQCTTGKLGSRHLRRELEKVRHVPATLKVEDKILVTCQTGRDLSVGVALAILCLSHSNQGNLVRDADFEYHGINKDLIKKRLSQIMVSMPDAAPSRATLQSVNAFLLGRA